MIKRNQNYKRRSINKEEAKHSRENREVRLEEKRKYRVKIKNNSVIEQEEKNQKVAGSKKEKGKKEKRRRGEEEEERKRELATSRKEEVQDKTKMKHNIWKGKKGI